MDSKSWINLLTTDFKIGEKKLVAAGVEISQEMAEGYYTSSNRFVPKTRMTAKVVLWNHYGHDRVTIEGDAELVHAILEKLK